MLASVVLCAVLLGVRPARSAETCAYTGTASHGGQLTVETIASVSNGETTVDVKAQVTAKTLGFLEWRYWVEEISVWRDQEMRAVAVNNRYQFAGKIQRQNWDLFTAGPTGLEAQRVQAKTKADFQRLHPGFTAHWDPSAFGAPWLSDYSTAPPERRGDLDLPKAATPPHTGSPLGLAFYWVRWTGDAAHTTIPVFLPGFKHDSRVDLSVTSVGKENGLRHLHTLVRHPQLSEDQASTGDAWISEDHRLTRVSFEARGAYGTARGELLLTGCKGTP